MAERANPQVPEVPLEEVELPRRLRQYINLRWLAIGAILLIVVLAQALFGIRFALGPVFGTTVGIALYNLTFLLWIKWEERAVLPADVLVRRGRAFAHAQIIADLAALTVLLHFTGGVENPFFLLYFIHVGFSSILLPVRDIYRVTALAIGLFAALVGLEYAGWLPHVRLVGYLPAEMYRNEAYVAAVLVAFVTTLSVVSAVATSIVAELRRQREEQTQARARELEQVHQQVAELDRMRTFFLALASHDLKTPLAVAVTYIQTILGGYVGEVESRQRRWLERTLVRLEEMIQLINDFLDVSQLDEKRIAQEIEPTCLADIAVEAVNELAARAREKEVVVETMIPPTLSLVLGSPKRLRRLLVNLLDNGIKFTPRGGRVTLVLTEEPESVRIEVMDTGEGIPTHYLPHIFEDYFRVRREEFIPGAGLGLSTARRIVEAHGGKIWVESPYCADHSGSKFTCCLAKGPSPHPPSPLPLLTTGEE
jgi:signal transduction histidine kinase